jgi:hypothetical protein
MAITRTNPPLPPADFPLVDASGHMTTPWRDYFAKLSALVSEIIAELAISE